MTPTTPIDPAQRIDQTYAAGSLVSEIVHNWPPDGGGVRRWVDDQGQERTEQVTGLPVPPPPGRTTEQQIADARTVLADGAAELEQLPAPATPADLTATVADILTRAAAALNGGA